MQTVKNPACTHWRKASCIQPQWEERWGKKQRSIKIPVFWASCLLHHTHFLTLGNSALKAGHFSISILKIRFNWLFIATSSLTFSLGSVVTFPKIHRNNTISCISKQLQLSKPFCIYEGNILLTIQRARPFIPNCTSERIMPEVEGTGWLFWSSSLGCCFLKASETF